MGVQKIEDYVYFAPTRDRRYLSRQAAINAEAKAIILKKHSTEPERYKTMHRRMCRLLKKSVYVMSMDMAAPDPTFLQSNVESSVEALIEDRKLRYCADSVEFVEGLKVGLEIAGLYGNDIKELYSKSIAAA